jgi:hypothetical protein
MENNTITIGDLETVRGIIELAVSRGTFKASEIADVGSIYDKLTAFVIETTKQAQQQALAAQENKGEAQ